MKSVFFTIVGSSHYEGCRTDDFIKSFKKFHPEIDLIVFKDDEIKKVFEKDNRLNFYNSKAAFAKLLYNDYDLVVNIDADHLIFDRLDEILIADYDVAAPANYNIQNCCGISVSSFCTGKILSDNKLIPYEKYIQAGIIASTSKKFWDDLYEASARFSDYFGNKENDILNLICHMLPYKFKILDGDWNFKSEKFNCYYGCSYIGRQGSMVVEDDKIKLDNKIVKAYHFAGGGANKPSIESIFNQKVCSHIREKILK